MSKTINSELVDKERLLPGIHGLRGLAALMVFLTHLSHIANIHPPNKFRFIHVDFRYGVQLFFIISAFSLYYSTESRIKNLPQGIEEYFIKRFFRIAPLFYFMIIHELIRQKLMGGSVSSEITTIVLNITFGFGFIPTESIVWGGWAVGVEMIFYAILPILLLIIRTPKSALAFLLLSTVISCVVRYTIFLQGTNLMPLERMYQSYFAFGSKLCFFAMGIFAFHINSNFRESVSVKYITPILTVSLLIALCAFENEVDFNKIDTDLRWDIYLWALGFLGLCIWQSVSPSKFFANKFFMYLGERSFSIYLLHPAVIFYFKSLIYLSYVGLVPYIGNYSFFMCAIFVLMLLLGFAEITYRYIEVSCIRYSRGLMKRGIKHE